MNRARSKRSTVKIDVVSDAEAETADVYVCATWDGPRYFDDDQRGVCCGCGVAIRFRPYGPKRPPKVCTTCAPVWVEATRH